MLWCTNYQRCGRRQLLLTDFSAGLWFIVLLVEQIIWTMIFVVLACVVVVFGLEKGIERANEI